MKRLILPFQLGICLMSLGCDEAPPQAAPFRISFEARSDLGEALGGVSFSAQKQSIGLTEASGNLQVRLRGKEGASLAVEVTCPEGYESPPAAQLRLARVKGIGEAAGVLTHQATCERTEREVALLVHAPEAAKVPVLVDGEPKGMTDERGNAHLVMTLPRDVTSVALGLDTTEAKLLRPQNPRRVFELPDRDVIAVFEPSLSRVKPARSARRASPRHVPYRVK